MDALRDEYVTKFDRVVVRMRGNASDVYGSGGDVDKEQYVLCEETPNRTYFDAQEVGGRQTFPVSLQKRRPSGVSVSLGEWARSRYLG